MERFGSIARSGERPIENEKSKAKLKLARDGDPRANGDFAIAARSKEIHDGNVVDREIPDSLCLKGSAPPSSSKSVSPRSLLTSANVVHQYRNECHGRGLSRTQTQSGVFRTVYQ